MAERPVIKFMYLNHHGKLAERRVAVECVEFQHNPGFGYQPGWFVTGLCLDKRARRSFALNRIELPEAPTGGKVAFFTLLNL